jgi:hypothetical protein
MLDPDELAVLTARATGCEVTEVHRAMNVTNGTQDKR